MRENTLLRNHINTTLEQMTKIYKRLKFWKLLFYFNSKRFFAKKVQKWLLRHKTFLDLDNTPYCSPLNLTLRLSVIRTKTVIENFKILHTGHESEITFYDNLYDIIVILRINTVYQIWDCMSHTLLSHALF